MHKFLVFLALLTAGEALQAQRGEIRISLVDSPMLTMEKALPGLGRGAIVDILEAAAEASGLSVSTVFVPLARTTIFFQSGETPFTFGTPRIVALNTGTDPALYGCIPFFVIRSSFFYYVPNRMKPVEFERLEDLRGLRVGIPRGYYLAEAYKKAGITIVEYDGGEVGTRMLMAGRIDLLDMIDIAEYQYINSNQSAKAGDFAVLARESAIFSGGITFKLSDRAAAETAGRFKAGLDKIMADGRYRAILKKYWGSDRLPDYLFRL